MYIHEAIAETKSSSDSIYRAVWLNDAVITKSVTILARGRMVCTDFDGPSPFPSNWNPTAGDLSANDWAVYHPAPIDDGFFTRYLGRWKL